MSMENAILELAAAIRELAGSGQRITGMPAALAAPYGVTTEVRGTTHQEAADNQAAIEKDRELEQAVEKVEAAAKVDKRALQKAIDDENDRLFAEKQKAQEAADAKANEPAATLDYKADVYPKLVALAKAKGKPALVGLLKEFDAANGDALKAEQYGAVVARAAELAA